MAKGTLLVPVRPVAVAVIVYPTALLSMVKSANVATPPTAGTVVVPLNVAPPTPVPGVIPMVTASVKVGTVLPNTSRAVTDMAGMVDPAVALPGCVVNTRWLAAAGVMLKAALPAAVRPAAVAESE
jgi:hypothetical protein